MAKRTTIKPSTSKVPPRKAAKRKKPTSLKKQSMRDVIKTPTIEQIAESIKSGTTVTANAFRGMIGW